MIGIGGNQDDFDPTQMEKCQIQGAIEIHGRLGGKRQLDDLVHVLDRNDLKLGPDGLRYVVQVLHVLPWKQHDAQTSPMSGEDFLAHATNGEYPAAQRDLPGHANIAIDRTSC